MQAGKGGEMINKKEKGKLILKVSWGETPSGKGFYRLVADATDGITSCIFFPHNGGSLIRIADGQGYSLTEGLSLSGEFPQIIKNENEEGIPLLPTSEGEFPGRIDIEDVLIYILRERMKIRKNLAEKGEEIVYEI